MKKRFLAISLCFLCALFFSGFDLRTAEAKTYYIRIGSTAPGALWYIVAARFADLITQKIPNVKTSVSPGGALANPRNVGTGDVEIGMTFASNQYLCYKGLDPYKEAYPDIRFLGSASESTLICAVRRDSNIHSYKDLYNKRINPLPVGYSTRVNVEIILGYYGITFDSIKKNGGVVHALTHSGGMAMMQDGKLDALWAMGGLQPTYIALSENPGIRLIGIDEEVQDKFLANPVGIGMFKSTYPKGVYKGCDEDIQSLGIFECFVVQKNMPDDLAYEITKILYESVELKDVYKGGTKMGLPPPFSVKKVNLGATIPIHPGAKRYFVEKGAEVK